MYFRQSVIFVASSYGKQLMFHIFCFSIFLMVTHLQLALMMPHAVCSISVLTRRSACTHMTTLSVELRQLPFQSRVDFCLVAMMISIVMYGMSWNKKELVSKCFNYLDNPKYWDTLSSYHTSPAGLGGSVGCAVRLETRRSQVQPPPRSATFFCGEWSWNIFYCHSLPSAYSRRAVVSFWRKNVHNTG